jgi:hypothetical protein
LPIEKRRGGNWNRDRLKLVVAIRTHLDLAPQTVNFRQAPMSQPDHHHENS